MRKIFFILGFTLSLATAYGQPIVNRASTANTVQDGRLRALLNLYLPAYQDTTTANLSSPNNIGIDSCGAKIYTRSPQATWYRACNPKRWVKDLDMSNLGSEFFYDSTCSCIKIDTSALINIISNFINDSAVTNISIVNDSTIRICYGNGSCVNIGIVTNITNISNVYWIGGDSISVCRVDTTGGVVSSVCDTIAIGVHSNSSIYQNWLRNNGSNVIEFGSDQVTTSPGLFLNHTTYTNTGYYKMYWDGYKIYDYNHEFSKPQGFTFPNGTGIVSFLHGNVNNVVRLGINYTADTVEVSPFKEGYFGSAIGYSIGLNWQGHGSYGAYLDDNNSKTTGIFFHSYDSTTTDGVTIYAAPDLGGTAPILNGLLKNYKGFGVKTNKSIQHYGYGSTSAFISSDTATNKPLAVDASGNQFRMAYWPGSGGGDSSIFATHHYVDSSVGAINLITANLGSGTQVIFPRNDTLFGKKLTPLQFITIATASDSTIDIGMDTASTSFHNYIALYSNTYTLPFASTYGISGQRIWFDTTINRLAVIRNGIIYHMAITDSVDGTTYDTDAQAYFDAIATAGTTLTISQKTAVNNYVLGLKSDGLWSLIYDQGLPVWGTAASSAIMLKRTHTTTWVGSPTFASAGVTGNGTTQYGNLNFAPSTAFSSQDNASLGVYIQSNVTGSGIDIGTASTSPTRVTYLNTRSGAATLDHINDNTNSGTTVASSAGFTLINRTSSSNIDLYKNGSLAGSQPGATSTGLATNNFLIMAYNADGTPSSFSTRQLSSWVIGATLTGTQAVNLSSRLNTLMTALGINVY